MCVPAGFITRHDAARQGLSIPVTPCAHGLRLPVRVTPGSRREGVGPYRPEAPWLVVRVAAPPVEGKANEALIALLARVLGLPPSCLSVTRGHGSRLKTLAVQCDTPQAVLDTLARALGVTADEAFTVARRVAGE